MTSPQSDLPSSILPEKVKVDILARLRSFRSGFLSVSDEAAPGILGSTPFKNTGAFLPLQIDHEHYTELLTTIGANQVPPEDTHNSVEELLASFGKPIKISRNVYDKPIAIVYNPVSGKGKNVREKILDTLNQKQSLQTELFETEYQLHAWDLVEKELDLTLYSAIAVVGGDGLFHEVVNGLLTRKERSPIPIQIPPLAFLPNGTGNDTVANFGVTDLDQALDFIAKGDIIQMDCNLLTLDAKSSSEVPQNEWRSRVRYSIGSSAVGFIAHVNQKATWLKSYVGGIAYSITGLKELLLNLDAPPRYTLEMEQPSGATLQIADLETNVLFLNNGKYAGGGLSFTPLALMNDGLLDVAYKEGSFSFFTALKIMDQASRQAGNQVFRDDIQCFRAKSVTVTATTGSVKEGEPQLLQIDGENLVFQKFVKIETVPAALDIIVDSRHVLSPMLLPEI